MSYQSFTLTPLSGALGAEISGVDISGELSNLQMDEIRSAFDQYVVLLFRDQQMDLPEQRRFAARFGRLIPHPYVTGMPDDPDIFEIVREPGENFSWDNFYHSDLMFLERPPMASVLYAVEVPPYGADTEFCNTYLAYETLSPRMQELAESLRGVNESGDPGHWSDKYESMHELRNKATDATHPIVRINPQTGRKALYLSPAFTTRFEGMTVRESAPLINFLYEHATQSHLCCRLHWQQGSVALWDNRVSLHHAVADYFGEVSKHRRVMRRATIEGELPVAA